MKKVLFLILASLLLITGCIYVPGSCSMPAGFPTGGGQLPTAYIDSVTPSSISPGEKVTFIGHGTDTDGTVVAFRWRSSISGELSVEAKFETTKLDPGNHIIFFKVQDNNGNWSNEVRGTINVAGGGTVPPSGLPVINSFTANPPNIVVGGSSSLGWNVTGANSVTIDQGIGNVAGSGTTSISPASTTNYLLTATNATGTITASVQVVVSGVVPLPTGLPVINTFTAAPPSILIGASTTLSWNVSGAISVVLDPGTLPVSAVGTKSVSPGATTSYTLTASNTVGWVSQTIMVTVNTIWVPPVFPPLFLIKTTGPLPSIGAEDGGITKEGATYTKYAGACAGDTVANGTRRGFLSFDISSIPNGSTILEATLDLSSYTKDGNPTYGTLGFFEIYHYQYGNYATLDSADFNAVGKLVKGGRYSIYPLSPWKLDASESSTSEKVIQGLVDAHKTRSQFKVQFSNLTDGDAVLDFFCFTNATLTIKYTTP
jgi:hypothetical protein